MRWPCVQRIAGLLGRQPQRVPLVAVALFQIVEANQPLDGLIRVSNRLLHEALVQMGESMMGVGGVRRA